MVERLPAASAIAAEIAKLSSAEHREATLVRLCGNDRELEALVRNLLASGEHNTESPSDRSEDSSVLSPPDEITRRDVQVDASVEDATIAHKADTLETKSPTSRNTDTLPTDQTTATDDSHTRVSDSQAASLEIGEQPTGAMSPSSESDEAEKPESTADQTVKSESRDFSINTSLLNDGGATQASLGSGAKKKKKLPPPSIPQYEIIEEIGQGGMGVVYKARHLKLKRLVALKMVRGSQIDDDSLARFHTEAESVAKIQHPNVVQIFEVGEHNGQPYLALEYVEGETLTTYAQKEKPHPKESAEIVLVLARAMSVAHELDVVHRDLKPSNILVRTAASSSSRSGDDRSARSINISALQVSSGIAPKITDFGLAKQLDHDEDLTQTGTVLGTPNYMSPEQAQGVPAKSPADIYALGAILYFLLTLRPPFRGKTFVDTVMKVRSEQPKEPRQHDPSVPADLEAIALKCLEKKEEDRYESASELANDLQRYLDGDPVHAASLGFTYRLKKYYERHKTKILGTVAATALVVLGALIGLNFYRRSVTDGEFADRLADSKEVEAIVDEFADLQLLPFETRHNKIEDWIERVKRVLDKRPLINQSFQRVQLNGTLDGGTWVFESTTWSKRFKIVDELLVKLESLDAENGLLSKAQRWLPKTPTPDDIRLAWNETLPQIEADLGFRIVPIETLMPVGKNETSGFWEFADAQTGHLPYRDEQGQIIVEPSMGLVFVLLPGGQVDCGFTDHKLAFTADDTYVEEADEYEYSATLSPFLVSKYEVTQSIWIRRLGTNGSFTMGPLNPIDSILWREATEFCATLGMELPTETQAEYYIRGGTNSTYNFGDDANIDVNTVGNYAWYAGNSYEGTQPVGQKLPNAFGLHDTLGNIAEWCQDVFDPQYRFENGLVDPVYLVEDTKVWPDPIIRRSIRGGSFQGKLAYLRSADRWREKHDLPWKGFGVRPVIRVEVAR